ncbi:hypothetical protein QYE76_067082 [Lolium multiflorum]|uniref:Integrase catalytic domain-containing protein n=1 Tax=Lolium multiflorum TaxID=4521 RepID=A0AAD8WCP9_LOLMU|nr:hypothetical protein QYE76_067082 [Lolium multiflorum]
MVRKFNGSQRYSKQTHIPASGLKTILITWPFAVWCLDMVGRFRLARGNMTHILVMVDKFTKWVEVKPIRKCDGHTAMKFLKDIILRYGYPHGVPEVELPGFGLRKPDLEVWVGRLRRGVFSDNLFIHGFFTLSIALLIVTLLIFYFRWSQNKFVGWSIVRDLISPLLALRMECQICLSWGTRLESCHRIKVNALIPRADELEFGVSSGARG